MENVIELEQKETKSEKTPVEWQQYWETEMSAANKRLRKYRRQGNDIVNRYLDKRTGDTGGYAGSSNSSPISAAKPEISMWESVSFVVFPVRCLSARLYRSTKAGEETWKRLPNMRPRWMRRFIGFLAHQF